ncbi:hypothetical protein D9613_008345 [Agrocybe pediades]|uniref:DUF6533 domain-containing protein n=1 Tax=Agrocybe pediades TaxID=84607 RepID=A0A8H4QTH7_9AGAR|nr:hypothetical protein D9613_008345 [Agrocybe pediades]
MVGLIDLLITGLRDIQVTRYAQLASSSIIVFDHLITLDEEINLIWKSSWSMGKILFLLVSQSLVCAHRRGSELTKTFAESVLFADRCYIQ